MRRFVLGLACGLCACPKPIAPAPVAPTARIEPPAVDVAPVRAEPIERCVLGPTGRLDLVPEKATFVVGIDLGALFASQAYADNRPVFEQGVRKAFVETTAACGLGSEQWQWATMGFDAASDFAIVLTADGIGRRETVACLREAAGRREGAKPWTKVDGTLERYSLGDEMSAWVLDDCTVVLTSPQWAPDVEPLVAGRGKSVVGGALDPALRRAVAAHHVWYAGLLMTMSLNGSPFVDALDVSGHVDLSSGFASTSLIEFPSATMASERANEMRKKFADAKPMLASAGMPQGVLDRMQFGARDSLVAIEATTTPEELTKILGFLRHL
jgi:hypothetical protein